jgi:hypothetical protein
MSRQNKEFLKHYMQEIEDALDDVIAGRPPIRSHKISLAIVKEKLREVRRGFSEGSTEWDNEIVKKLDELEATFNRLDRTRLELAGSANLKSESSSA